MRVLRHHPSSPLSRFVDYFWYMEGYNPVHSREIALPDGSIDVIFELKESPILLYDRRHRLHTFKYGVLCGPHTDYFVIDNSGESKVLGIHFKPGGLHPFQAYPLDKLLNCLLPLDDVFGAQGALLYEELLCADSVERMFEALENRLNALARKPLERSREVAYIHDRLLVAPIQELVGELSISHRTLISKFKEEIGMSPKRLTRLLRFQEVLSSMEDVAANQDLNWADIALACGYYDQAHFIHEFRAFSGMKPTDYQSIPGRHMNHAVIAPDP